MGEVPDWVYRYRSIARLINKINTIRRKKSFNDVENEFFLLDTKACGDFTLMHRSAWLDIQGYTRIGFILYTH
jgi:hypothetical protein